MAPILGLADLRFLLSRSRGEWLVEELGGLAPLGPTGLRDVQGVGNNTANPISPNWWFGAADTLFLRLSFNRLTSAFKNDVISGPFANSTRGTTFAFGNTVRVLSNGTALAPGDNRGTVVDALNPRTISNLIADVSNPIGFQALDPNDPFYAQKQELLEQDNPVGRIGPVDGGINPLPYSNWTSQFGQFFDHGLDFVNKGVDGAVSMQLLPSDSLYSRALATGSATITGSRNNTVNVTIGAGSTDALLTKMGFTPDNTGDTVSWAPVTTQTTETNTNPNSYFAYEGTLVLNNKIIEIYATDAQDLITQINDWTPTTGVLASLTPASGAGSFLLTLTPARAESFNQISPPVDMSQNYGSDKSRTVFLREYLSETEWRAVLSSQGVANANTLEAGIIDLTTGRLVNAGVAIKGEAFGGMANWSIIKGNAAKVGLILHDKDVEDVPLVAMDANGQLILDADGMPQLVAINKVTGEQVYIKDSNLAASGLNVNDYVLATTGHAFLNDKAAFSLAGSTLPNGVVVTGGTNTNIANPAGGFFQQADFLRTASGDNPANYTAAMTAYFAGAPGGFKFQPLDSHLIAGDGRLNENIGLTAVHEVFLTEHNRVLTLLKQQYGMPAGVLPPGGFVWTDPLTNQQSTITNEDLFQQAKIWVEMIYQHLTFDQFIRKLSPNVAGFAGVDPAIDSQIFAEFAHAIYRLGHSMLPEEIGLRKFVNASSLATTSGSAVVTVTLTSHGLKTGDSFVLSDVDGAIGGIAAAALNGTFTVTVVNANSFTFTAGAVATATATGLVTDTVLVDLSRSLIAAFLSPTTYTPGATAGQLADGSNAQVGYRIDEKVSDSLRDNLLGRPLDLATLNLMRGRDGGLPTLNELRGAIAAVAPVLLQPTLTPYSSWSGFRDNLKGTLDQQNATVKNFMMAYAADALLTEFAAVARAAVSGATVTAFGGLDSLDEWYQLRASTVTAQSDEYMLALKAATNAAFANAAWMGTNGNKDYNRIDAWIGGLAEREVVGGMLGSTFDAIFAIQMMNLQNGDFFYYLGRVPATEFFVEGMEGTQYSDLVMRNSTATDVYGDIFSVADSYEQVGDTAGNVSVATLDQLAEITTNQQVFDLAGNVIQADIGTAGVVNGVFTGNPGNYVDARGVLNPNGVGNASEMITGTIGNDRIQGLGGNDTVRADAGNDTIDGGSGVDFLYGGDGNDSINGGAENDFIYGGAGNDILLGGLGTDTMFGNDGADTMYGGSDAGDIMIGGTGDDLMYGGDGVTTAVAVALDPLHPDVVGNVLDVEQAVAVAPLDDTMNGGQGNDTLYGGGGWDVLSGESGHDMLFPGTGGADILGREALDGGQGDDLYIVEYASWFLDGDFTDSGLTTDQLVNKSTSFRTGNGIGIDEVRFTQTIAADIVLGGTNLQGVAQLFSGIERVVIGTGTGDTANRNGNTAINIDASLVGSPGAPGSTQGIELLGNAAANVFIGTAFDDYLDGGAGNDTMEGGLGNDTYVLSGAGDVMVEDPLLGGGSDTVVVGYNANYTLNNLAGGQFENLTLVGTNGTADINGTGNSLDNVITGNAGDNDLSGLGGADTINGGGGNDSLSGGAGNDWLAGGDGNDTLFGGAGSDTMVGGAGVDVFLFNSAAQIGNNPLFRETIVDFDLANDILNFNFDGDTTTNGTQGFNFIGQNAFTAAGQLRFENGVLYGNTDADLAADFQLALPGVSDADSALIRILPRSISITGPATFNEGSGNSIQLLSYEVRISAPSNQNINFNYALTGTGTNPVNALDFATILAPLSGTGTIAAGETTAAVTFVVNGDNTIEPNETLQVTISNVTGGGNGAVIANASAQTTLVNDDGTPTINIVAPSTNVMEGSNGTGNTYNFTVSLSIPATTTTTVQWAVTGTGTNPANAADFPGGIIPSGTLTFLAGQSTQTLAITVAGDNVGELDETFQVTLSNPIGGILGTATATTTIFNDDNILVNLGGSNPYQVSTDSTWRLRTSPTDTPLSDDSVRTWDAISAVQIPGGYNVLLAGAGSRADTFLVYTTDPQGNVTSSSGWKTSSEALSLGWDTTFPDFPAAAPATINPTTPPIDTITGNLLLNTGTPNPYQVASDPNWRLLHPTLGAMSDASIKTWDAKAAIQTPNGYDVLLEGAGSRANTFLIYSTDNSGSITASSGWQTASQAVSLGWENLFQRDLNGDNAITGTGVLQPLA